MSTQISATVVADSKVILGGQSRRITSMVLTFPRFILAEFNTHRAVSRNSASSRAIPFKKMVEMCKNDPFIPIAWQKDHSGMQGSEYFTDEEIKEKRILTRYFYARDTAVQASIELNKEGVTKQLCNRILEPYLWHTVLVTATEWENFFALRADPAAEIHMQALAERMLEAMNASEPRELGAGEWHIPFGDQMDMEKLISAAHTQLTRHKPEYAPASFEIADVIEKELKIKIAVARCARLSYLNYDGSSDYSKDIALFDKLSSMGHWSAFEHVAQAMTEDEYFSNWTTHLSLAYPPLDEMVLIENWVKTDDPGFGWWGNFQGWKQMRKMMPNENRKDSRLIKK